MDNIEIGIIVKAGEFLNPSQTNWNKISIFHAKGN